MDGAFGPARIEKRMDGVDENQPSCNELVMARNRYVYTGEHLRRCCAPLVAGAGQAFTTSFASSLGFFRRAEMKASTPSGRLRVSNEINVTWTLDSYAKVSRGQIYKNQMYIENETQR